MRTGIKYVGLLAVAVLLVSCSDTLIDPFENEEDRLFAVYGYLNPLDTLQTVRVIPISRRNEPLDPTVESISTIEAEVISIDLTNYTVAEWTHSLKQFPDGSWGHFFTANFPVRAGHRYRLIVTRVDGSSTSAETVVPDDASSLFLERSEPYLDPEFGLVQDVTIPEGRNLWDFQTTYRFSAGAMEHHVIIPFDDPAPLAGGGPWTVQLPLGEDQSMVAEALSGTELAASPDRARLTAMGMLFRVLASDWAPYLDQTDTELLSRSDQKTNVRRGAGFFGSMGLLFVEWAVPFELSQALGYDS